MSDFENSETSLIITKKNNVGKTNNVIVKFLKIKKEIKENVVKKEEPKEEVIEEKKPEINKKALYPGKKKTETYSEGEIGSDSNQK